MFRISQLLKTFHDDLSANKAHKMLGPVVILNLIRRCKLRCKHCYSASLDMDFNDELSTEQVKATIDDLKVAQVSVLIFSGDEPLLRSDIYEITAYAKAKDFYVVLSTNGTLINEDNIAQIKRLTITMLVLVLMTWKTFMMNFVVKTVVLKHQ